MKRKERVGYIYILVCLINGKGYVGQTINTVYERWLGHLKAMRAGNPRPLYRAMRRYGEKAFLRKAVWIGSESELDAAEKRFIRKYKTFIDTGWGYNLTTGGSHRCVMSASTRKKISAATKKSWKTNAEFRKAIEAALEVNRSTRSGYFRAKAGNATRRMWADPAKKAQIAAAISAAYAAKPKIPKSAEERAEISRRTKLAWKKPGMRAKYVEAAKRRAPKSEETRARMSIAMKKRYEDPEARAATGRCSKRSWKSAERRAKASETQSRIQKVLWAVGDRRRKASLIQSKVQKEAWVRRKAREAV